MNEFKNKSIHTLSEAKNNGAEIIIKTPSESKSGNTVIMFKFESAEKYNTIEIEDEALTTEILSTVGLSIDNKSTEEVYYNSNKEVVSAIRIQDLYSSNNCTTKNKKVMEYLDNNILVHQWDGNHYFVIGTKKSMVKISKKPNGNIMTTW